MRLRIFAVLVAVALLSACGDDKPAPPGPPALPPGIGTGTGLPLPAPASTVHLSVSDACQLLTKDELAPVLGSPVRIGIRDATACDWSGPERVSLALNIVPNGRSPQAAIDDERDIEQAKGNPVQMVSGVGDAAVFAARDGNPAGYILMVARADLLFMFTDLDSLPDQDGKNELAPAWQKVLALAVSRAG